MKKDYIKYFISLLLCGSNGIFASMVALNSYEIVYIRALIGSILLILLYLINGNRFTFWKHKKSFLALTISGIAMGGSWIFLFEAYQQIGISIASLCYYCGPVIVMALAPLLFREKLSRVEMAGFLTVLIGILLINSNAFSGGANFFGIFCGLMSAIMYAVMVIFYKKSSDITGFENSTLQLTTSFLTVAIFVIIKQGPFIHIPVNSILPLLILGLINTGIGCYLYFTSISNLPVQTVAICGYLEPLSAVVFSVLFLSEHLQPLQMIGVVCIIGGAIWSEGIFSLSPRTS